MKPIKILFYAVMLLSGVSCVKEESQTVSPMTGTDQPYFMALGSQVGTKVSLMENGTSVNWTVGDLVAVADGSGDIYKFASEGDGTNAIFRYQSEGQQECMFNKSAEKYLMVYPWTASVAMDMKNSNADYEGNVLEIGKTNAFIGNAAMVCAIEQDKEYLKFFNFAYQ